MVSRQAHQTSMSAPWRLLRALVAIAVFAAASKSSAQFAKVYNIPPDTLSGLQIVNTQINAFNGAYINRGLYLQGNSEANLYEGSIVTDGVGSSQSTFNLFGGNVWGAVGVGGSG